MNRNDATFLPRAAKLLRDVADEYAGLADKIEADPDPHSVAALSVVEDIAGAVRLALENFRVGRYSRAMKRLLESEYAYRDISCLTLRHIKEEDDDAMALRFVDNVLAGRMGAW